MYSNADLCKLANSHKICRTFFIEKKNSFTNKNNNITIYNSTQRRQLPEKQQQEHRQPRILTTIRAPPKSASFVYRIITQQPFQKC